MTRSPLPRAGPWWNGMGNAGSMPPRMGSWQPERLRYGAATKGQRAADGLPRRTHFGDSGGSSTPAGRAPKRVPRSRDAADGESAPRRLRVGWRPGEGGLPARGCGWVREGRRRAGRRARTWRTRRIGTARNGGRAGGTGAVLRKPNLWPGRRRRSRGRRSGAN